MPDNFEERLLAQCHLCDHWLDAAERGAEAFADMEIWMCGLGSDPEEDFVNACAALMSEDERALAARFRSRRNRNLFIWQRAIRRVVLSRRIGTPAGCLQFAENPNGKPFLMEKGAPSPWRFSVSHKDDILLIAMSDRREAGVDIESVKEGMETNMLMRAGCNATERAALMQLPRSQRARAFLQIWTRKEACIKALGAGADAMSGLPDLHGATGDGQDCRRAIWHMGRELCVFDIDVGPRFAASLACGAARVTARSGCRCPGR
ncbi:MAG: 4'-phosphopantetheinyl transferase superfamily protein [Candidatus Sumerlaeota bacterium]|nr:4'-phosphopantetheinyl transferase superfamily protein [Candidatus Sumerlaeota bacterium]